MSIPKLFEVFPDELKSRFVEQQINSNKRKKSKSQSHNKPKQAVKDYAYPKLKKLPLETRRNILSAISHFDKVRGATDADKVIAFKKIIQKAKKMEICTMGFYKQYGNVLSGDSGQNESIKEK